MKQVPIAATRRIAQWTQRCAWRTWPTRIGRCSCTASAMFHARIGAAHHPPIRFNPHRLALVTAWASASDASALYRTVIERLSLKKSNYHKIAMFKHFLKNQIWTEYFCKNLNKWICRVTKCNLTMLHWRTTCSNAFIKIISLNQPFFFCYDSHSSEKLNFF